MVNSWSVVALAALAALSTARAACDDLNVYFNIPTPMTEDMEINLDDVDTIECVQLDENDENNPDGLEEVLVSGGILTIKSSSNVRFVNVGFTVADGAELVFDMPKTKFGPNTAGSHRTGYTSAAVEVEEGGTVTFMGQVVAKEVTNVSSLFRNNGNMEFQKKALFQDGGNVFYRNTGTVKFRGNASFKDNRYLAVDNHGSGYFRFSKEATFDNSAEDFDGAYGCSVTNYDSASRIVFRGDTVFQNDDCFEGISVYNHGTMQFYGKAYFNDNKSLEDGGAVLNILGSMTFKGAVQFNNNFSADYGGGIAVKGGDVTFKKSTKFNGNIADSGAAFAVLEGQVYRDDELFNGFGTLTFSKPSVVGFTDNVIDTIDTNDDNCSIGEVADGATVVGFPDDDVCSSVTF